jgi:hypothetical protein
MLKTFRAVRHAMRQFVPNPLASKLEISTLSVDPKTENDVNPNVVLTVFEHALVKPDATDFSPRPQAFGVGHTHPT